MTVFYVGEKIITGIQNLTTKANVSAWKLILKMEMKNVPLVTIHVSPAPDPPNTNVPSVILRI